MVTIKVLRQHSTTKILTSQNDIGANTSVTNDKSIIHLFQLISSYYIGGVEKDETAITCIGKGYILWQARTGEELLVPVYYCKEADGTIISPHSVQ